MTLYLIRLDDACPTMDVSKWEMFEKILDDLNIKPLVAVIPDNKDPNMIRSDFDSTFWSKVRKWQVKGWDIALHGYDHNYISKKSGLIPFNSFSEFAGVSYEIQKKKITEGFSIFQKENIKTRIWVAPAHSFDEITLKILLKYTSIDTISDGLSNNVFKHLGFKWVPQKLWKAKIVKAKVTTICYHPNEMSEARMLEEKSKLALIKNSVVSFDYLLANKEFNRRGSLDVFLHHYFILKIRVLGVLSKIKQQLKRIK